MTTSEKFIKQRKIPKGHERAVAYFTLEELKEYGEICALESVYNIWNYERLIYNSYSEKFIENKKFTEMKMREIKTELKKHEK